MILFELLYFMLPAYVANMMPVLVKKVPFLNSPVDGSQKLFGKPILGNHKTWRGILFGMLGGIGMGGFQFLIHINVLSINYAQSWFLLSVCLAGGALLGDAIKSFFKRRFNIAPGLSWKVFDQLDYVSGALCLTAPFFWPGIENAIILLVISGIGHVLINHVGFWVGINKKKW